jgi:cell wall assembly regulator SMI1
MLGQLSMSRVTELLNQLEQWVSEHNPKECHQINMTPGLTIEQIQFYLEGKPYKLPFSRKTAFRIEEGVIMGSS